ncbi:hypothetical protein ACIHIX_25735 [Streptomyces sp. NPDC051913]|uniref:hypothetical protein n=1 Tax=Streptomyces sp. NPDC051913 TaxID=3365676 RepID=UPI0037D452FF
MADDPQSRAADATARRWVPPPALVGFLLLLVLVFTVSYAVGSAVGPVAPGMHGTGENGGSGESGAGADETSGTDGDMGEMPGMSHGGDE